MKIAKLIDKNQIECTWFETDGDIPIAFIEQGFKPLVEYETELLPTDFQRIELTYTETDDSIIETRQLVADYTAEMAWNREQLDALDWKSTRNLIAEKAGLPPPIGWKDLYNETQIYRDRINYLETL